MPSLGLDGTLSRVSCLFGIFLFTGMLISAPVQASEWLPLTPQNALRLELNEIDRQEIWRVSFLLHCMSSAGEVRMAGATLLDRNRALTSTNQFAGFHPTACWLQSFDGMKRYEVLPLGPIAQGGSTQLLRLKPGAEPGLPLGASTPDTEERRWAVWIAANGLFVSACAATTCITPESGMILARGPAGRLVVRAGLKEDRQPTAVGAAKDRPPEPLEYWSRKTFGAPYGADYEPSAPRGFPLDFDFRCRGCDLPPEPVWPVPRQKPPLPTDTPKSSEETDNPSYGRGGCASSSPRLTRVCELTNQERARYGSPPVQLDPALQRAAAQHARFLAGVGDNVSLASHELNGGLRGRLSAVGKSGGAGGENLVNGRKTPEEAVSAWMNSHTGHRENLLNPRYRMMGVAEYQGFWVQKFYSK